MVRRTFARLSRASPLGCLHAHKPSSAQLVSRPKQTENKQAPRSIPRRLSHLMLVATRASACPTSIVPANNSHVRPLIQIRSVSGERPPRVSGSDSLSLVSGHVQTRRLRKRLLRQPGGSPQSSSSPRRIAYLTNSARLCRFNLSMTCVRCVSTVFGLIVSRSAIWLLV